MSTLKRTPHLLTLALGSAFAFGLSGCASTPGQPRTGALSKMKTYLAIGEKPLPVVSGAPGSTVSSADPADVEAPSPRRGGKPDGRISGRVYDPDGRPVSDARVRLAISGQSGGKVVKTTTDRSGAFTLHGLRVGSNYTLIAEWEDETGPMTGRINAATDDNDVRISLVAPDEPVNRRAAAPPRVNRISDREEISGDEPDGAELPAALEPGANDGASLPADDSRSVAVNEDDLPPALEAENLAPQSATRSTRRSPPTTSIGRSSAWRTGNAKAKTRSANPGTERFDRVTPNNDPEASNAPIDPETRGTSAPIPEDEDGPNPLPPALERAEEPAREPEPRADSAFDPAPDPFTPLEKVRPAADTTSPLKTEEPPPRTANRIPGSIVAVPVASAPLVLAEDPFGSEPPASNFGRTDEPAAVAKAARSRSAEAIAKRDPSRTMTPRARTRNIDTPAANKPATRTPRKPTWGDLSASATEMPPLESASLASRLTPDAKADPRVARRSFGVKNDPKTASVAPAFHPKGSRSTEVTCDYDDRHRRIIDFRLPDLEGNSVRFKDIDADLILLDFWGTWCQPCLRSVPHLIDLQERKGKSVAVIGIACEPGPNDEAVARVSSTVQKMKINYPVLLSKNDGTCPLQEALHVSAFPTLILVDRQGRVIWRDQGSTPATLARLDRVLGLSSQTDAR